MRAIDEVFWNTTRRITTAEFAAMIAVVDSVNQMLAHPEARALLLKARKLVDPTAVIPEWRER